MAYAEVLADQKEETAVGFPERAERLFLGSGIPRIERVMTDNGACSISRRFRRALQGRSIGHLRTRPYRPEANGTAERFIQTMLIGGPTAVPIPPPPVAPPHSGRGFATTTNDDLIAPWE